MQVYEFVSRTMPLLSLDTGESRAKMARLRRACGKELKDCPDIWEIIMDDLPEDMPTALNHDSYELNSRFLALTLFALHQSNSHGSSLGEAMRMVAPPGDEKTASLRKRFNQVVVSKDYAALSYHLRGLVKLLKAKDVGLDFALLAKDLYDWQFGGNSRQNVVLRWGLQYYKGKKLETYDKMIREGGTNDEKTIC
jgi:CRISPR system Cascade subunit CasB